MSENMMPELTLTPDDTAAAAAVEVPSLTLTPEAPEVPKEEEKKIEPALPPRRAWRPSPKTR